MLKSAYNKKKENIYLLKIQTKKFNNKINKSRLVVFCF